MSETRTEAPEKTLDQNRFGDRGQVISVREVGERALVVKRYGRKRTPLRQGMVQLGHWTFAAKSGTSIAARAQTEREVAELWRGHGFDTFEILPDDLLADESDDSRLVMEFVEGRSLYALLADRDADESLVRDELRRFGADWRRRHALAIEHREPRLLHEHGTFKHVWLGDGRQINFDFEICWTSQPRIVELAGREAASFLRSMGRACVDRAQFESRLRVVTAAYADRRQIEALAAAILRPRRPLARLGYWLERFKRRRDEHSPRRVLEAFAAAAR